MAESTILNDAVDDALRRKSELQEALRHGRNFELFAGFACYAAPELVNVYIEAVRKTTVAGM